MAWLSKKSSRREYLSRYKRFLSFFLISSGTVAVRTRGKGLRGFTSITEIRRGTYNGGLGKGLRRKGRVCSLDREWKRSYPPCSRIRTSRDVTLLFLLFLRLLIPF